MKIALNWSPSTIHGWGIYGLNLALGWSADPEIELCFPPSNGLMIDPLRAAALRQRRFDRPEQADIYLWALGNEVLPECETPLDRTIGMIFFEEPLSHAAIERAKRFPLIITGSTWNEQTLRDAGLPQVRTIFQGVDRTLFHPAPRQGLFSGKLAIFSGGKAEWRKGQDIVLAAFKVFSERHHESLLVTAWQSPFPHFAEKIGATIVDGRIDVKRWAAQCGIDPNKVIDIGLVHQPMMPQILRECDCAVFPNRAEGGTNLVAMEAMACGVPTWVSQKTGHTDLSSPYWLHGEEVDGCLLQAMEMTHELRPEFDRGTLHGFYWADACAQMKAACKEICP